MESNTMWRFPDTPKKIQAAIKRYEKALHKEQSRYGMIDDGFGKRYLLGPLYVVNNDIDGAIRSFTWFEETFPDDVGDPGQYLCWAFALYKSGDLRKASHKLRQVMLMNLYLLPKLLGIDESPGDIWHGASDASPEYLAYLPPVFFQVWDDGALAWAAEQYQRDEFVTIRTRYAAIQRQLKQEPVGPTRTQLVKEASALRRG
jgi:hypothetical protein